MHVQGVLAMSWSGHDSGLLLSSAKDKRTILWDVATGESLGEVPAGDSWDFDVLWSPSNPGVFATSSYGAGEGSSGKVRPRGQTGVKSGVKLTHILTHAQAHSAHHVYWALSLCRLT